MVRRIAVDTLAKIAKSSCLAQEALATATGNQALSHEDQSFLWELVHGVLRHRETIDRILAHVWNEGVDLLFDARAPPAA